MKLRTPEEERRRAINYMLTALAVLLLVIPFLALARPVQCNAEGVTKRFDLHFQTAAERYLPKEYNWCGLKALCRTESNLNPYAESPVGAVGLCQLMAGTWNDVRGRGPRTDAKRNAEAAARYLAKMHAFWISPRSNDCRWELMVSSYNAGPGSILKAQELSGGRRCWSHIQAYLNQVTGDHSKETTGYVLKVWSNYRLLRGYGF